MNPNLPSQGIGPESSGPVPEVDDDETDAEEKKKKRRAQLLVSKVFAAIVQRPDGAKEGGGPQSRFGEFMRGLFGRKREVEGDEPGQAASIFGIETDTVAEGVQAAEVGSSESAQPENQHGASEVDVSSQPLESDQSITLSSSETPDAPHDDSFEANSSAESQEPAAEEAEGVDAVEEVQEVPPSTESASGEAPETTATPPEAPPPPPPIEVSAQSPPPRDGPEASVSSGAGEAPVFPPQNAREQTDRDELSTERTQRRRADVLLAGAGYLGLRNERNKREAADSKLEAQQQDLRAKQERMQLEVERQKQAAEQQSPAEVMPVPTPASTAAEKVGSVLERVAPESIKQASPVAAEQKSATATERLATAESASRLSGQVEAKPHFEDKNAEVAFLQSKEAADANAAIEISNELRHETKDEATHYPGTASISGTATFAAKDADAGLQNAANKELEAAMQKATGTRSTSPQGDDKLGYRHAVGIGFWTAIVLILIFAILVAAL